MKNIFIRNSCFYFLAIFLLISSFPHKLFAQYPTDSAKIYLLTVSPGEEIYSFFGHSAIQIYDRKHSFNVAYGYGNFDFDTPHFYEKFVFGRLLYSLSVERYEDFILSYQSSGQTVYQQSLNLTNKEKWNLMQNLQINYRPENRYYRYDFLYDNCATRIRDIIEKSVDGKLLYDSTFVKNQDSFRGVLSKSLEKEPWVALGINTMLGLGSDKIASVKGDMFLPDHMKGIFTNTRIKTGETTRNLMEKPVEVLATSFHPGNANLFTSPDFIFSIFFVIVLLATYWGYRKKIYARWFDIFLFSITGLLGLLFLTIWIGSLHKVMACNMNMLWANPFNLIFFVLLVLNRKHSKWFHHLGTLLIILFLAYIPVSLVASRHFYLVPVLLDIMLTIRLWKAIKA